MTIILYEVPLIIYSRYKRMRQSALRDSTCIRILSELNGTTVSDMKKIIKQETQKEKTLGVVKYFDLYRHVLSDPNLESYVYEISDKPKSKQSKKTRKK